MSNTPSVEDRARTLISQIRSLLIPTEVARDQGKPEVLAFGEKLILDTVRDALVTEQHIAKRTKVVEIAQVWDDYCPEGLALEIITDRPDLEASGSFAHPAKAIPGTSHASSPHVVMARLAKEGWEPVTIPTTFYQDGKLILKRVTR